MLVVDRFEENIAVCEKEDKTFVKIPKYKLPLQIKEGDFITLDEKGVYVIATEKTEEKKQEIHERFHKLFK
ncbi:MAG: DUF3006 domain-containing protein [Roseburia sp.]|nr:DUF3006 domain-containing protein [Roseburia sp.]MCM1277803.1 DUF3006 domain-containing protein [Robinsoniella sp.]